LLILNLNWFSDTLKSLIKYIRKAKPYVETDR
jgi:hypothetical protein